jgi:uncharacterized protein (TIGR02147 family)
MSETENFYSDYRKYLEECFRLRCLKNPRYSQAAFARDLSLSPSTLSELMNGKYGLSAERALEVGKKLKLNSAHNKHFVELFRVKFARKKSQRKSASESVRLRQQIGEQLVTNDKFKTISEWHHLALLELTETSNFKLDKEVIGKRLGLTSAEVTDSIARLERLGLVKIKNRKLKPTGLFTTVDSELGSAAISKYQTDLMQKGLLAMDAQSREERDVSSVVFAFAKEDMLAAKSEIQEFRRNFALRFSKNIKKEEVYCLSMQMFALTTGAKA